jgi:hypothetical protein
MRQNSTVNRKKSSLSRLAVAASNVLEPMEKRVMMSATVAAWNFDSLAIGENLSPAPSSGTGTALTVGLQTSSTNAASPGGVYAYPNPNASGTGDESDILNGSGNEAGGNDNSSTGLTTGSNPTGTNPAWRIRGTSDGWSDSAAVASQGAQFLTSTSGNSGISLSFDIDASSTSAPAEVAVQYTTNGGTSWTEAPTLAVGTDSNNGASDGMSVLTNSTNANLVSGEYFQFNAPGTNNDSLFWQNGLTATFPTGADNNSGFGVRIVNAATGSAEFEVGGAAYPVAGAGNWRLDNIKIISSGGTLVAPSVTTNPMNQTVAAGQPVTFTAASTGNPTPTVQWYEGTYPTGTAITGATSATYTFTTSTTASDNNTSYYAVFTNSQGSANTTSATLTDTLAAPVVTTQPTAANVSGGSTVTFTAAATGSPLPTVQWQTSTDNSTFTNVSGGTSTDTATSVSSTFTLSASLSQNGTYYRAVFVNSQAPAGVASNSALLNVSGVTIAAWNFTSTVAAPDNSPAPTTGSGTATSLGFTNTYTYAGTTATNSVTNDDITSVTPEDVWRVRGHYVATGIAPNVGTPTGSGNVNGWNTQAPEYSQGVEFDVDTTGYQSINVSFDWEATAQGVRNLQEQYNLNTANSAGWTNINSVLTAPSGGGYLTGNSINLASITGANNDAAFGVRMVSAYDPTYTGTGAPTYTAATLNTSTGLAQPINNSSGNWGFGNIMVVGSQIPMAPAITTQPTAQTVTVGSPVTFTAAASGYPVPTVQWYSGNTSNPTLITGANSSSYTFTPTSAQNGTTYFAIFTNSQGTVTTNVVSLTVNSSPIITVQPTSQNVTAGATATFTAAATGYPTPTVQWQSSSDGTNFSNIAGATSATYSVTASSTDAGLYYRAVFSNATGSTATNAAQLNVVGAAFAQWIFNGVVPETIENGLSDSTLISNAAGSGDAPLPTLSNNPYNSSTGTGDIAQTLGLFNDYTGVPVSSGADIGHYAQSGINPSFNPYSWRIRSNHTETGWSQLAPQETTDTNGDDPQGVLFRVNTTGYTDITLHFDWDGGGIADMQPQYSPDGGTTWIDAGPILQNFSKDYPGITAATTPPGYTVSLEGSAYPAAGQANSPFNNPNFQLRLVAAYDPNLPLISDGNSALPTVHGQYADSSAGAQNAVQVLDVGGLPTDGANPFNVSGGTYQLSFGGQVTAPIAYNASPATVQADLDALSSIGGVGGSVTVADYLITPNTTASANDDFLGITFGGSLGDQVVDTIGVVNNTLTGSSPTATVQTWIPGAAAAGIAANGYEVGVTRFQDSDAQTGADGGSWELADLSFNGLAVSGSPTVVTQPANTTVIGGTTATFTSTIYTESTPVTAQWQINTGSGWTNIPGATNFSGNTSSYSFTTNQNLSDSGDMFRVVFTNPSGSTTSFPATLTVVAPVAPSVTAQPAPVAVEVGNVAQFTATATGSPSPTVQWQVNSGSGWTNLTNGSGITGATTTTLSVVTTAAQVGSSYQYRAVFTNVVNSVASNPATLTVLAAETTVTDWNFGTDPIGYTNSPAPSIGTGTATAVGFDIPFDYAGQADGASGTGAPGAVNADDITSTSGADNPAYTENTWRIRGGVTATSGGAPANGWSNYAKEYTQGAQYSTSTVGYNSIYVTMDVYTTTSGELNARQQYTLDGVNWYNLDDQQLAYNGSTNPNTGLDDLNPTDPYAPLNLFSNDFYGATATYDTTSISSVSLTNNVVTVIDNNDYQAGESVNITGIKSPNTALNGIFTITAATSTSFSYALVGSNIAPVAQTAAAASLGGYIIPLVFNLTGIAGVANNPNFGVRLVNAYNPSLPLISSTLIGDNGPTTHGQYAVASSIANPTPYPGSAGNWRFDNIVIHGVSMTPAWLSPGTSTYTWSAATETLTITSGTATIIGDPAASGDSPLINVTGNASNLVVDSTTTNTVHIGGLKLSGGATASITAGTTDVLVVASGGTFSIAAGSTLDINNNFIDLVNGGSAGLSQIDSLLASGYNNGAWNGTGIISSTAAADGSHLTTVGAGTGLTAIFDGITPGASDVLLRYTYYGDANLNGIVDGSDYSLEDFAALNGLSGATGWVDFNYDGVINGSDYTLLDNAYNTQGPHITPATQVASKKSSVFAGGAPISSVETISDLLKKDKSNLVNSEDVVDALGISYN